MAKKKETIKLEKFDGCVDDFINSIGIGEKNAVYMKKDRSSSLIKLWWENKDKWFCNWGSCKTTDLSTSDTPWVIGSDLKNRINMYVNKKLHMYTIN